ncbi:hypothetical protein BDZ89DRAFT_30822 [Hymenopellis radicata]|nr:hypothetical protein BDZ89DRAFT_30822 [Hymenopellis radicata]
MTKLYILREMTTLAADPPAAPRLPQEIFDIIINHCHSDKDTLSVLGLVSWSWLHSARRHLFARVELCELLHEAFDPFWRVDFGLQIITRSPAIASCIRFLQIRASRNDHYLVIQGFHFLSLLPNLRALSLTDIFWPSFQPGNIPTILRGIATIAPALEDLSLTSVAFASTADLTAFVRAFPMVKRVSFSCCEWDHNWPTSVFRALQQPPVKPCFEHVCIHDSLSQAILEVLLQRDTFTLDLKGATVGSRVFEELLDV